MSRSAYALARLLVIVAVGGAGFSALPAPAHAQVDKALGLWEEFCHNVQIAKPQLAADFGQTLLDSVDAETLLDAVEAADYDAQQVLDRAKKTDTVKEVAEKLEYTIQNARISRARDPERIARDIDLLALGDRANVMATQRLRAAGQYAAPQLLATLQNPEKKSLHPFVIEAMVAVGEELVYPLAVALPDLEPVQMSQVAQVLARIGYPLPLPYLKQIMEAEGVEPSVAKVVEAAFDTLIAETALSKDLSASQLFTLLGRSHYAAGTHGVTLTGYDPAGPETERVGLVWAYLAKPTPALQEIAVPGPVYADARAMQVAKQALELQPDLDQALSLYLASNFRRENNLPDGKRDPSYTEPQPAMFYAMLAGPQRLHDVLTLALNDGDADLALDAIAALATTAGTEALTTTRESLLRGLTYPDRRVRFRSAEALATTRPDAEFNPSYNVVKILADQVRQSDKRYAMVIADDRDTVNELIATLNELGFEAFGSTQIGDLTADINSRPGVDIIVVHGEAEDVKALHAGTLSDFKLNQSPILGLVSPGDQIKLKSDFHDVARVFPAVAALDAEALGPAVEGASSTVSGAPIGAEEGLEFAVTALLLLRDIALGDGKVYNVLDAQAALEQALGDEREPVVTLAGAVLSLIGNESAQRSIFDAALGTKEGVQVSLLQSLAASAQHHGNFATAEQTDALLALVKASEGDTAIAAAQAHGSLMLSTDKSVSLINAE